MSFQKMFKDFNFKTGLKIAGIVIVGLLILGLVASLGGFAFRTAFNTSPFFSNDYPEYAMEDAYMTKQYAPEEVSLSMRNIMPDWESGYAVGSDLEEFEVVEYSAYIETGRLEKVCGEIKDLKAREYVIFENSNESDNYCNYTFKVEKDKTEEILTFIKDFNPEELNVNTDSIKRQIQDFTNEEEILNKRLDQIEETLENAQDAYDEVTDLATNSRDVETLAKIINDKINLIERLTNERMNTLSNLDKLSQLKADQLDRLDYTFFTVSVSETLIVNWEMIKDSWEWELENFVNEFNRLLQGISLKLLSFGAKLLQIVIYLIIALFVAKYGWKFVKFVWRK